MLLSLDIKISELNWVEIINPSQCMNHEGCVIKFKTIRYFVKNWECQIAKKRSTLIIIIRNIIFKQKIIITVQ